ncbi:MAG: YlxR family protein [Syntrophobacteria bacterium]
MGAEQHVPQRTCIVCGSKRAKKELVRLVLDVQGRVCFDWRQRSRGRGAYVCRRPDCLVRVRRRRLQKAFRKSLAEAAWNPVVAMKEALQDGTGRRQGQEIQVGQPLGAPVKGIERSKSRRGLHGEVESI